MARFLSLVTRQVLEPLRDAAPENEPLQGVDESHSELPVVRTGQQARRKRKLLLTMTTGLRVPKHPARCDHAMDQVDVRHVALVLLLLHYEKCE